MRTQVLLVCFSILTLAQAAADIYVPADYATIQEALYAAMPGESIHVASGVYNPSSEVFPLLIDRPVHLLGAQAGLDPRPSTGGRAGDETVLDAGETSPTVLRIVAAADVEINGFTITGGTGDMVEESGHADGLRFRYNILYDDPASAGDDGIQIKYSAGVAIEFNYAYNIVQDAFNLSSSSDGVIRFNDAHDIASENAAIYCYDVARIDLIGNVISNVPLNDGIKLGDSDDGSTGGRIADNLVSGCGEDGITVYARGVIVEDNVIHHCCSENGALYLYGADTSVVRNNRIFENDAIGILLKHSVGVSLLDNQVYDNDDWDDVKYAGSAGIWLTDDTDATVIRDNCLTGNADFGLRNDAPGDVAADLNWWGDPSGPFHPSANPSGLGDAVSDHVVFDPWHVDDVCQASAMAEYSARASTFLLATPSPNPAAGPVRLAYTVPRESSGDQLQLSIYDATGRLLRRLDSGARQAGDYVLTWDGTDRAGNPVGPGLYLCKLQQGTRGLTRRIVRLR